METKQIIITSIIVIFLLYLVFNFRSVTANVVAGGLTKNFVCSRQTVETDVLKYPHSEKDYNIIRLCCEQLGGFWYDSTEKIMKCSSMFMCSGRYNPKKPWPHCVLLKH
ncbi:MAG: hypothetical protein DRO96_00430 [Candidatus Aenigmatarchaeota archaeon]|nr:MAG: hypothetical protein DRO96_00430 [Candidatus Aenigmarchaeota archaeon]